MLDPIQLWKMVIRNTPLLLPLDYPSLPFEALRIIIEDESTDSIVLDKIARAYYNNSRIIEIIIRNPSLHPNTIKFLLANANREIQQMIILVREKALTTGTHLEKKDLTLEKEKTEEEDAGFDENSERYLNVFQQIQRMNVSAKIQLALKGNKEARNILIKDSNKKVALTVLESPKLTEQEVEMIAQSRNASEDVLREIASKRDWLKNYAIVKSLLNNPKTPVGISLSHLNHMKEKDLKDISKNKNISETIRASANRLMLLRKTSKGSGK